MLLRQPALARRLGADGQALGASELPLGGCGRPLRAGSVWRSGRMRILICTAQVPFVRGGAETLVDGLHDALREHGHEVDRVALPFSVDATRKPGAKRPGVAAARLDPRRRRASRSRDRHKVSVVCRAPPAQSGVAGPPASSGVRLVRYDAQRLGRTTWR